MSAFALLQGRHFELPNQGLAARLAAAYLQDLGGRVSVTGQGLAGLNESQAWQDSGLAVLTPEPPLNLPMASTADALVLALNVVLGDARIALQGRRLLGMRRLSHALQATGAVSANGSCRLMSARDGTLAVNLARSEDWELLPAWLETEGVTDWLRLESAVSARAMADLLQRGRLLGLPVAPVEAAQERPWFELQQIGRSSAPTGRPLRVLDMSNLWAGPLTSLLLCQAGMHVTRLENPQRPDGARQGPPAFFKAISAGKQTESLDLTTASGQQRFRVLLGEADLLIESARPRGLQHLGLQAEDLLTEHAGLSWLSITGYGRQPPMSDWVAFGDDAAVAGGLAAAMAARHGHAQFCGDAIADPLAGLHAALVACAAMQAGGGYLISVALRDVVSNLICRQRCAGPV